MSNGTAKYASSSQLADLKRRIAASVPDFQERVTQTWAELLQSLEHTTQEITQAGPDYIPQVEFKDLASLKGSEIDTIKRKGCVVIKNVVDTEQAQAYKTELEDFVKANPGVEGIPEHDKQFFMLYWTKPQVEARAHSNVLSVSAWLNGLYHVTPGVSLDGVDLKTPLSYADRFRIRHPTNGELWNAHPPHIDGGAIERWEDDNFRSCFDDLLGGDWKKHDPYDLRGRLNAKTSLYGRPNQSSVFRTFQGWLALSETAPREGTLKVFPDVLLSNAYVLLRPFFRPVTTEAAELWKPGNWKFDVTSPDFPGLLPHPERGYMGPKPTDSTHPHLKLDETMTSVPKVQPGDMVFWHCDVVHSVEPEHKGNNDSIVMYIPAVPLTPQNAAYIQRQKDSFIQGRAPPDFPVGEEGHFVGAGKIEHVRGSMGRKAMGLPIEVA